MSGRALTDYASDVGHELHSLGANVVSFVTTLPHPTTLVVHATLTFGPER